MPPAPGEPHLLLTTSLRPDDARSNPSGDVYRRQDSSELSSCTTICLAAAVRPEVCLTSARHAPTSCDAELPATGDDPDALLLALTLCSGLPCAKQLMLCCRQASSARLGGFITWHARCRVYGLNCSCMGLWRANPKSEGAEDKCVGTRRGAFRVGISVGLARGVVLGGVQGSASLLSGRCVDVCSTCIGNGSTNPNILGRRRTCRSQRNQQDFLKRQVLLKEKDEE